MKIRFHILFAAAAVLIFAGRTFAAGIAAEFDTANKFYDEGKFSEAAAVYEKILQAGTTSPNLLFNYGNAEFKSGHLGRAIVAYRRAAQLMPRDADVRANLEFARNQVSGATERESHLENWLGALTLNEWTALTAIAFWLLFALLAARQIWPALKTGLRGFTIFLGILTILSGACLGAASGIYFSKQTAIVVAPDAIARSGPFNDAQNIFTAHDGAEFTVRDRHDGWVQIADGSGKIGWLEGAQTEVLPGS